MRALTLLLLLAFTLPALAQPNPASQWSEVYGTDNIDIPSCMIRSSSGLLLTVGYVKPSSIVGIRPALMKIGPAGSWLLSTYYTTMGNGVLRDILELPDRSLMLLGMAQHSGFTDYDLLLIKADSAGVLQWFRWLGERQMEMPTAFVPRADGGYLITGSIGADWDHQDVLVIKVDSAGQLVSERAYGGSGREWGECIRPTADGNFIIASHTTSFGAGGTDAYLLKVNADGDTLWTRTYGGADDDEFMDMLCLPDGNLVCVGNTQSFGAGAIYVVKLDATGNELWSQHVGGNAGETAAAIVPAAMGGFVIAGEVFDKSATVSDGYLRARQRRRQSALELPL